MPKLAVLICGILSPVAAVFMYKLVSRGLLLGSADPESNWLFRLTMSGMAMTIPFFVTLAVAVQEGRHQPLSRPSKLGLAFAVLSVGLTYRPIRGAYLHERQVRNLALRDVAAPPFDTSDIFGNSHRLADHRGEVVLVNVWATWCVPCREEVPKLDELYRSRKEKRFIVFGISAENVEVQRKFVEQVSASYPFLTLSGQVPDLYRSIVSYPAVFLIDREGRLQPAPGPAQPFEKVAAAVDSLLNDTAY